MTAAELVV